MQIYSAGKIAELRRLRRRGLAISELVSHFSMPKTSIWHHIHDIKLSDKYIALIKAKQGGSKIRSQKDWDRANQQASEIMKGQNKYPYSLAAMLYWAEGNKKGFVFTNTDGQMIKLLLNLLRNYFDVTEERIDLTLRIFSNLNREECLKHWSSTINFPKEKFRIYLDDGGKKGKSRYGICRLTIRKSGYLNKLITVLINNISADIIGNDSPRSSMDQNSPVLRDR